MTVRTTTPRKPLEPIPSHPAGVTPTRGNAPAVRTGTRSGAIDPNHNRKLRVRTTLRAGAIDGNHAKTLRERSG
jgi:hypothetical protein